jgi:uncharacterized membrane protein YphA (DoxX/SURF4 family)
LFQPLAAHAHEVYVLPHDVVEEAIHEPGFSLVQVALDNIHSFLFWAGIAIGVVAIVFFISVSRTAERACDPFLTKLKPYAATISRVTIGLSFLTAAYHEALFGPELPLQDIFGSGAILISGALMIIGVMVTVGWYTRIAAVAAIGIFLAEVVHNGWYMLTYANYLGELLLLLVLGAHHIAIHHKGHDRTAARWLRTWKARLAPYVFPLLRVSFGISLLYASLYAKVIHNQLVLEVTKTYPDLVAFFGFEPHFLILGAAIIEIVIGLFFILGIEIRFTSLFVLFWLSLSLWYFGEAVWPHIILIGIPIAFIFYGYDKYSLEGYFYKRDGCEPVL